MGAGAWGVESSINPTLPNPPAKACSPPSDMRAVGKQLPWGEGGTVGVMDGYKLSRPEAFASGTAVYTLPPRPPPPTPPSSYTRFPDIPVKGRLEIRCRKTEAGGGSGCPALRWAGIGADLVRLASTPRAGEVAGGGIGGGPNP